MVLVDTPIWSNYIRRRNPDAALLEALRNLVDLNEAVLIGPVRQEILSGVREDAQFDRLRKSLRGFRDVSIETADYERAAAFGNVCRQNGVQGSAADFLICALAFRLKAPVFTTDKDFVHYSQLLPILLFESN